MDNKLHLLLIGIIALCLCAPTAQGQIRYGQPTSGGVHFTYSYWKMEQDTLKTTLNQLVFPLSGFVPLRDNMEMRFYLTSATNNMDTVGNDMSLSGLGDLRVQVSRSLKEDQLLLSAGMNLPTGKKKLDVEGQLVQLALSQNFLDVPLRRLGEGFGFNLLVGVAHAFNNINVGGGITYKYNGSYDPYNGVTDYDPGDMISLNAGADITGEQTSASIDAIYSLYTTDKLFDREVFRQSPTFDIRMVVSHNLNKGMIHGQVRYVLRGKNKLYTTDMNQQEIISSLQLFGNEFMINGGYTFTDGGLWKVTPSAELRLIAANDDALGSAKLEDASVIGIGADTERQLSDKVNLFVGGRFYTGSANGGNIDLTGLQFTGGLSATF